jgi:hypothetical protein
MNDKWVKFFHIRYPQLEGLTPILDSMTYREELIDFPDDHDFREPRFFLIHGSTEEYPRRIRKGLWRAFLEKLNIDR